LAQLLSASAAAAASTAGVSASSTTSATVQVDIVSPPICTADNLQTNVAVAVSSNPTAAQIITNGLSADIAAAALGQGLNALPSDDPIKGWAYVIIAFGVPVPVTGGVSVTVLFDAIGNGTLTQTVINTLCPLVKHALAASASLDDSQLVGCTITVVGQATTLVKRSIGSIEQSGNTNHMQMTSTLPSSSSSSSSLVFSFVAFVAALFFLKF